MLALVTLAGAAAVPAIKQYYLNYVLDRISVNDAHPPKTYWRCPAELCGKRTCGWVDENRRPEVARFGWTTLNNRIYMLRAQFTAQKNSAKDDEICLQGLPAIRVVAAVTGTRPLYDGALYESTKVWKAIGTVLVGAACEDGVVRQTTVEYHYVTNAAGLRGLAACAGGDR